MATSIRARAPSVLLAIVALTGCAGRGASDDGPPASASFAGKPAPVGGLRVPARATATHVQLATRSGFADRFWPGVNLGATTPGHLPGEVSARAKDYRRWFGEMAALGTPVIRVYTLLDPSFYRELRRYNLAHTDDPIYVIHGVWIPEERLLATRNLWDRRVVREMDDLVDEVHAAVFGRLRRAQRPGLAHGTWDADISPWVIAWSPGVEWDPPTVHASERKNPPRRHRGRFITTVGHSTSTEAWIARALDHLAALDHNAGWSRAMTFTNWLTADPLRHPEEPFKKDEDLISVDAMHLKATRAWPGGFFASYHAYPYYPDFLRLQRNLRHAEDPYTTYLRQLRAHHRGQAVMVTEFGIPSSLGKAHLGPLGRDQGDHSEREAAKLDAGLLAGIRRSGYAGGILFEWTDVGFKRTWNTADEEVPERGALWRNVLTNEEHFGVLATEPGGRKAVDLDGEDDEWADNGSQVLWEGDESLREVRATHDEAYLYLRLRFDDAAQRQHFDLGLDVRPGSNRGLPGLPGVMPGADVALRIRKRQVRIWRREAAHGAAGALAAEMGLGPRRQPQHGGRRRARAGAAPALGAAGIRGSVVARADGPAHRRHGRHRAASGVGQDRLRDLRLLRPRARPPRRPRLGALAARALPRAPQGGLGHPARRLPHGRALTGGRAPTRPGDRGQWTAGGRLERVARKRRRDVLRHG